MAADTIEPFIDEILEQINVSLQTLIKQDGAPNTRDLYLAVQKTIQSAFEDWDRRSAEAMRENFNLTYAQKKNTLLLNTIYCIKKCLGCAILIVFLVYLEAHLKKHSKIIWINYLSVVQM